MQENYVLVGELASCGLAEYSDENPEPRVTFSLWTQTQYNQTLGWKTRLDALYEFDPTYDIGSECWRRKECNNGCCSVGQNITDFDVIRERVSLEELKLLMDMDPKMIRFEFEDFEIRLARCENRVYCRHAKQHKSYIMALLVELPIDPCRVLVIHYLC
jgi:hypothetical protein